MFDSELKISDAEKRVCRKVQFRDNYCSNILKHVQDLRSGIKEPGDVKLHSSLLVRLLIRV